MKVKELMRRLILAEGDDEIIVEGAFGIRTYPSVLYEERVPEMKGKNFFIIDAPFPSPCLTEEYLDDAVTKTETSLPYLRNLLDSIKGVT